MLLLGIDIGTSSIKVSVVDAHNQRCIDSTTFPENQENKILSIIPAWAEQSPETWWEQVQLAIKKVCSSGKFKSSDIGAIGIAYQMHGLVVVDKEDKPLRNAIIWCDSRAVEIGQQAFQKMDQQATLAHMLNAPGNFTASKWAWVKANEPEIYQKAKKIMLPGDYIGLCLTGESTTSISALSEGIFWDFKNHQISKAVMDVYGFDSTIFPDIKPVFGSHGSLRKEVATALGLPAGIPVAYKAGDQPNNALSLNVLKPGEVAATAGTSGVIYAVSDQLVYDKQSRVNTFAHVNHTAEQTRTGVLLCINGTGILNRWVREHFGKDMHYEDMNMHAKSVTPGSLGLQILPFGNGAERIFNNQIIGAHLDGLDLNAHGRAHVFRASQEGIAYAFRYGLDILRENAVKPSVIRVGKANMFLSSLFAEIFVDVTQVPVEVYENDGSVGAALGAGIGSGIFKDSEEAFSNTKVLKTIEPGAPDQYENLYQDWKKTLVEKINSINQ
jgi:xylulokinase